MKIIYFTSAIKDDDFSLLKKDFDIDLNPSNQNFHNKLIRSLAINNIVEVVSLRPFNKKYCHLDNLPEENKIEGNIHWHYLKRDSRGYKDSTKDINAKANDSVIVVDTLNVRAMRMALKFSKSKKIKTIGILTDNPVNITRLNKLKQTILFSYIKKLDAYIALTDELNNLFNKSKKPYLIMNGVVEKNQSDKENLYGEYILFAGALLRKYGVYELIDAFSKIDNQNIKLLICGHHKENDFEQYIKKDQRIVYLGNIDYKNVTILENNALICINPRPIDKQIDDYSFPSKMLEFLISGSKVISTKHPLVYSLFKDDVFWLDDLKLETIEKAINDTLKTKYNKNKIIEKTNDLFGLEITNQKINLFINKILKK